MAKSFLKAQARELRSQGRSIKDIAGALCVSSSTASLWCRDIRLSEVQITQLEQNAKDPHYGRRLAYALKQQAVRQLAAAKIRAASLAEIGKMSDRDKLIAGVSLYWAEGFKKDKMVGFANTDPLMVKFTLSWLQNQLFIPPQDIKIRVGINESHRHRTREIEIFWSQITQVPLNQFQKPFYQKSVWKKVYEHPEEYFGVVRIRVAKSTNLLRRIKGMIEGLNNNLAA